MKQIAGSPRLRLAITLLLTIAIGVLSSIFATQVTPNGTLDWSLATKVSSFWWLLGSAACWLGVHLVFLNHDENLLRYADDQHCIAHIRKTKLEGLAALVRSDPEKASLVDAKTVLKNLEVKTK
ncbi:MAG: hypothetical protein KJ889_07445 [Gammaproteobacteria bacterium]|nr:hypothetical protein [Gammaproteobacteria bacterium]